MASEFIADPDLPALALLMAHDLRNVFSVVTGTLVLLEKRSDPRYLERIREQLEFCEQMVSDFVSCAEAGRIKRRTVEVTPIVQRILASMSPPAGVSLSILDDCGLPVLADPVHVQQILWNLLHNAVNALGDGRGSVGVRIQPEGAFISVTVQDDGPGVDPALRESLVAESVKGSAAGHGLGLFLSRKIAEANGGKLAYEPVPGGGSRFILVLPASNAT